MREFHIGTTSTIDIGLPRCVTKTIEYVEFDATDINESRKIRNQKQCGYVSLMVHMVEVCDPNTYVDAHGQLGWENSMIDENHTLMKK